MTQPELTRAGPGRGISANESADEGLRPHVGSEFQLTMTGSSPITAMRGINLDADWPAVFQTVPPHSSRLARCC